MQPISNLFGQKVAPPDPKKPKPRQIKDEKYWECMELVGYFMQEVNRDRLRDKFAPLPIGYFRKKLAHLKEPKDFYYLKSVCEDARRRGGSFTKKFWFELDPEKYKDRPKPWEIRQRDIRKGS